MVLTARGRTYHILAVYNNSHLVCFAKKVALKTECLTIVRPDDLFLWFAVVYLISVLWHQGSPKWFSAVFLSYFPGSPHLQSHYQTDSLILTLLYYYPAPWTVFFPTSCHSVMDLELQALKSLPASYVCSSGEGEKQVFICVHRPVGKTMLSTSSQRELPTSAATGRGRGQALQPK